MKILVTGGAGYVGSKLIPALLEENYEVHVLDLYLYGDDVFEKHHENPKLKEFKGDIRDLTIVRRALEGCDAVIHLACISNDPSFELNPALGKSINLDAFEPLVQEAKNAGVKRFIYASSSSVYGIKEENNVTEDMELEPLTDYSKYKAECEKILNRYKDEAFTVVTLRPATVCGYSKRLRLDLVVNILTSHAYHNGKIKVMGGEQLRPNIHIGDMVRAYLLLLEAPKEKIQGEVFNVGYHNHSVLDLGKMVQKIVSHTRETILDVVPSDDNRSYHVSSEKIDQVLGFKPEKTIEDAVSDLIEAFEEGKVPNALENELFYNIRRMKNVELV